MKTLNTIFFNNIILQKSFILHFLHKEFNYKFCKNYFEHFYMIE